MRWTRCTILIALIALIPSAQAILINFEGTSAAENIPLAGIAQIATMNTGLDGNLDILTIEIWNTSPVQTDPGIANPLLTGLAFWLPDGSIGSASVLSWNAVLGSDNSVNLTSLYNLTSGNGIGSGLNYFTIGTTGQANQGRIGNPAAIGEEFGIPTANIIFSSVLFTFAFADGTLSGLDPSFFLSNDPANIALRFLSVGTDGSDSGSAIPGAPVPEPTSLALLGIGILMALKGRGRK